MPNDPKYTNAQIIAELLSGAWRNEVDPAWISPEALHDIHPIVLSTGAGPLCWRRIETVPELRETDAGQLLRKSYLMTALRGQMLEETLERICEVLDEFEVIPLIFKGWSVAQYYGDPDLRPFGDIDLCAPPDRYLETAGYLSQYATTPPDGGRKRQFVPGKKTTVFGFDCELPGNVTQIDLHRDLQRFRFDQLEAVYARSRLIPVKSRQIRVLSPEDHLRLLCLHFLDHGGWRPIWLCDIAALLEALPDDFDWDLCLGDDPLTRHWVEIAVALACQLLCANPKTRPQLPALPSWLITEVLEQWRRPFEAHMPRTRFLQVLLHYPLEIVSEAAARWPNKIRATCATKSRFDDRPRWPYQLSEFSRRAFSFFELSGAR